MEEYQEIISEEHSVILTHEMFKIYKKGGLPVLVAPPGAGKTTKIIVKLVDLLRKVVVSFPYHPLVNEFYKLIQGRGSVVALAGGKSLCLGELRGEFRYFTGRCIYCRYLAKSIPLRFPIHYNMILSLANNDICPYNVLKTNANNADMILKTHKFVIKPLDRPLIYDEVHQDVLGRIIIRERLPQCKKTKSELLAELEELRQKCLMDMCDDGDIEKIELLQELLDGMCLNVDDNSVILVKNPPQKISFGLTATPPEKYPKRWDVLSVEIKQKPKLIVVPNVRTAKPYDISDFLSLYEYLRSLNNDIYVAAPQRILDVVEADRKFAIWGRESHGLTYSSSAILISEPWLHVAAYERLPYTAIQLTLIQVIQVAGRIRPWNKPNSRTVYIVGPLVERHEKYFSQFFDIEFVLWDGQGLRRI